MRAGSFGSILTLSNRYIPVADRNNLVAAAGRNSLAAVAAHNNRAAARNKLAAEGAELDSQQRPESQKAKWQ